MKKITYLIGLILIFIFFSNNCPAKNDFSFKLISEKGTGKARKWVNNKKYNNSYYILHQNQHFSFKVHSRTDGYVSFWYKNVNNTLLPFINNKSFSLKRNKTLIIGNEEYDFVAKKPDITEYFYAVLSKNRNLPKSFKSEAYLERSGYKWSSMEVDISPMLIEGYRDTNHEDCKPLIYPNYLSKNKLKLSYSGKVYLLALGSNTDGLQKAHLDACRFSGAMQHFFKPKKINIQLRAKAKRNDFIQGLRWLQRDVKKNDLVIIYFSGHGSTRQQIKNEEKDNVDEVYVMRDLLDNLPNDKDMIVRDNEFYNEVKKIQSYNIISIVDACYSAGSARLGKEEEKLLLKNGYIEKSLKGDHFGLYPASRNTCDSLRGKGVLLAASKEKKLALEGKEGGKFTISLLNTLANARQNENLLSIFNRANREKNFCLVGNRKILQKLVFR